MRSRLVWFVAGSAAGVYSAAKARRVAYRLSAPGVVDQASALGVGWRAFSAELRDGMQAREHDIVRRLSAEHQIAALSLDEALHDTPDISDSNTPGSNPPGSNTPDKKAP